MGEHGADIPSSDTPGAEVTEFSVFPRSCVRERLPERGQVHRAQPLRLRLRLHRAPVRAR